jgi:hypothetical protein
LILAQEQKFEGKISKNTIFLNEDLIWQNNLHLIGAIL